MTTALDLSATPLIDNHCHAVEADQGYDLDSWRARFTESPGDPVLRAAVPQTAFYRRLIRALAERLGTADDESAVLSARSGLDASEIVSRLLGSERISGVVVDTGYPDPQAAMPLGKFSAASGAQCRALLRVEGVFERLITEHDDYDDLIDALDAALLDLRGHGYHGLKSVVGYRTGLGIERWDSAAARAAFATARTELAGAGSIRLGHKPLLDTLLHRALAAAADQRLPVQFHVGYGDRDVDLRAAAPLQLRNVLEDPAYQGLPTVLLHGCWPYFRDGAFLASVYGNVYLDLSYGIPFLSLGELRSMTRAALGTAPLGKLMYSSDGARVPELHWLGARDGRRLLGEVLAEQRADGELSLAQAEQAGAQLLFGTAERLYEFSGVA